ncbi:hypothetical protein DNTS_014795 [Danionella cerebrum]|uniref:Cytochrome c oxidase assembly factor 1 homolog n=1 Tax=Danionella cerebrum TaxID=2873325 RepID=A0A553QH80_9TELE|nr:hypothetical protein DNTS_014795 [Danionella translucida]TRY89288.1 hypothetical protein DNTS_014795 [Danionella translucida]
MLVIFVQSFTESYTLEVKMSRTTILLQKMTIFMTLLTGGSCATMYYLMQGNFAKAEHYRMAVEELKKNALAMASLGSPPLKIHNLHLTDGHNRFDESHAQLKIPVSGSKARGFLYTNARKDPVMKRWELQQVVLSLKDGESIEVHSRTDSE